MYSSGRRNILSTSLNKERPDLLQKIGLFLYGEIRRAVSLLSDFFIKRGASPRHSSDEDNEQRRIEFQTPVDVSRNCRAVRYAKTQAQSRITRGGGEAQIRKPDDGEPHPVEQENEYQKCGNHSPRKTENGKEKNNDDYFSVNIFIAPPVRFYRDAFRKSLEVVFKKVVKTHEP